MWICVQHRGAVRNIIRLLQRTYRQSRITEEEKAKITKAKISAMWSKQVENLLRKREMLSLIREYIVLQERYVSSRLTTNKRLLAHAKYLQVTRKRSPL
ncbi:uncharacterized protein Dmoj_GI19035, isoform D [Drosophila mojavensis]|uniref:Uncharacterized protein, isoform D n=1 Tax=Drosophila mojavensis TaxID=7230 RepID=B4KRZ4_DROMO|nr:uncharacterized protein Dmoj_GI19035, isoform D [Drosophila mojavensis]